jgi:uncharacterized protein (TIGR03066 family)
MERKMFASRRMRAAALVLGLTGFALFFASCDAARAADKEQDKVVGKWVLVKANGGTDGIIPTSYEFTQKGGVTYTFGKQSYKGTYKVKGNKVTLTFSARGVRSQTRTLTIQQPGGDVMVEKSGPNVLEFKKQ